ncbi:MAG: apolipoprotein N-acyltransferase [Candidatus Eisenbacteria bacterium]|nr:apolipoprotein N-acyltransferase [Candidatus Eisenbacteria bacterium]
MSVFSGVLAGLPFQPLQLGLVSYFSLVPLLFSLSLTDNESLKKAFWLGYIQGVVSSFVIFYWIVFLPEKEVRVPGIMFPALAALALYLSLYPAIFCLSISALRRRFRIPYIISAPFIWCGTEYLRSLGVIGFPWASFGYALSPFPSLLQIASLTGVAGLSFLIILSNTSIFHFLAEERRGIKFVFLLTLLISILGPLAHGKNVLRRTEAGRSISVLLIQGNIGSDVKWDERYRYKNFQKFLDLTRKGISDARRDGKKIDLVIWPETAIPSHVRYEYSFYIAVADMLRETGIPLLSGYPDSELDGGERHTYNAAGLFLPGLGLVEQYRKIHLVPFGERIPFQTVLTFLKKVDLGEADFSEGKDYTVFSLGGSRFGTLICFESIFAPLARQMAVNGAEFFANITNDEWFGRTAAPYQHAYMAILRTVENRIPLVRCANTGVSMAVDPYGRVLVKTGIFETSSVLAEVPLGPGKSFYREHGEYFGKACLGVLLAGILACLILRKRHPHLSPLPRGERKNKVCVPS